MIVLYQEHIHIIILLDKGYVFLLKEAAVYILVRITKPVMYLLILRKLVQLFMLFYPFVNFLLRA
jgi:hypothetical protein